MASSAYIDAFVKYSLQFPTKDSLGSGDPPADWQAEYLKVSTEAFDAVSARSLNVEGGNASFAGNFSQIQLVRAICAVRKLRDPDWENPYESPVPEPMPAGQRMGSLVRLGLGC